MRKIFILFFFIYFSSKGQEPNPYFSINTDSFKVSGMHTLEKYQFTTIIFYNDSLFINNRNDFDEFMFIRGGEDSTKLYVNIHPFPVSSDRIGKIRKGSIYSLQITKRDDKKQMRLYFRSCNKLLFGTEVFLNGLQFVPGTYFYDMLTSEKKYETGCNRYQIELENLKAHEICFEKLKEIIERTKIRN